MDVRDVPSLLIPVLLALRDGRARTLASVTDIVVAEYELAAASPSVANKA